MRHADGMRYDKGTVVPDFVIGPFHREWLRTLRYDLVRTMICDTEIVVHNETNKVNFF